MSLPTYGPWHSSDEIRRSCETTTTPSLVTPVSSSSVVTPICSALPNAASVFSGRSPRVPRWPSRSKERADGRLRARAEHDERREGDGDTPGA